MKPNELIKILDSGVVHELKIYYCGGCITTSIFNAPFELPDYEIVKMWQSNNGRGISVILADGIAAEKETRHNAGFDAAEKEQTKDEIPLYGIWKKCEYDDGGYNFECSKCKQKYPDNPKYCPNCGKIMQTGGKE